MFHDRENITLFYCLVTNFVGVAEARSVCGVEAAGAKQQRAELEEGINELWERREQPSRSTNASLGTAANTGEKRD